MYYVRMFVVVAIPLVLTSLAHQGASAGSVLYDCKFKTVATPEGVKKELMELDFIQDTSTGKAVMVGNNGTGEVSDYERPDVVTFLEFLITGSVHSTSIDLRNGKAIHSRHTHDYYPDEPDNFEPSQYYGDCEIERRDLPGR